MTASAGPPRAGDDALTDPKCPRCGGSCAPRSRMASNPFLPGPARTRLACTDCGLEIEVESREPEPPGSKPPW